MGNAPNMDEIQRLQCPGTFKLDHLLTVGPIWFNKLLRNSRPSWIRRDMLHVAQDLKKAKIFFLPVSGSQALGIGAGMLPGTL